MGGGGGCLELTVHPYPYAQPQCEHRPLLHGASQRLVRGHSSSDAHGGERALAVWLPFVLYLRPAKPIDQLCFVLHPGYQIDITRVASFVVVQCGCELYLPQRERRLWSGLLSNQLW